MKLSVTLMKRISIARSVPVSDSETLTTQRTVKGIRSIPFLPGMKGRKRIFAVIATRN